MESGSETGLVKRYSHEKSVTPGFAEQSREQTVPVEIHDGRETWTRPQITTGIANENMAMTPATLEHGRGGSEVHDPNIWQLSGYSTRPDARELSPKE